MTIRTDVTDSLDCNYFQYGSKTEYGRSLTMASTVLDHRNPTSADSRHTLVQLWSFRCLVQSTPLNTRNQLNGDDLVAVSNQLRILEESIDFKAEHICCTGIRKVLRSILKLAHISTKGASAEKDII
jgi:hypothetical protein